MRTPLAWLNLLHNKSRTAVAIAGVTFSILLIFMQLGFLGAISKTATMIYEGMDFDIVIRSPEYLHLVDARTLPVERLRQAAAVKGVRSARPFYAGIHFWRNPQNGSTRGILCMAVRPGDQVFRLPEIREQSDLLRRPNTLLIDRLTRREFGPGDGLKFSDADVDVEPEIGDCRMRIVGHYAQGTGLASDGAVVMSDRSYERVFAGLYDNKTNLVLINIEPGTTAQQVADRLRLGLPRDVRVLTRSEALEFEVNRWINETSLGIIFKIGVVMALVVGVAIVYQVLSSDIENQMAQYATMKAIGYSNASLASIVLQQSVLLAIVGFIPGLLISTGLYFTIASVAYIPIEMTLGRIAVVFFLTLLMCTASGLGALRKVTSADPADLF